MKRFAVSQQEQAGLWQMRDENARLARAAEIALGIIAGASLPTAKALVALMLKALILSSPFLQ